MAAAPARHLPGIPLNEPLDLLAAAGAHHDGTDRDTPHPADGWDEAAYDEHGDDHGDEPSETAVPRWLQLALYALPVLILLVMGWNQRWASDDAYINFRVIENIAAGNGPVFNYNERVEAGTSPLWIMILTPLRLLAPLDLAWSAVLVGLAMAVGAVAVAMRAALTRADAVGERGVGIPIGMLLFVSVGVTWDFATSGLETGLAFLWLATITLGLARRLAPAVAGEPLAPQSPWWVPVLIGLGPLVRPDFVVVSVVYGIALLVLSSRAWRDLLRCAALALALPLLYEIFRMGYYGLLVPNTALAKEASRSVWWKGMQYLGDFVLPYRLWIPLALLVALAVVMLRPWRNSRAGFVVFLTPIIAGVLHASFVLRVGGDFMHGRFLLPAFFMIALPFAVVRVTAPSATWPSEAGFERAKLALVGLLGLFALVTGMAVRYDESPTNPTQIMDERAFYANGSGSSHPITLDDYAAYPWVEAGRAAEQRQAAGEDVLIVDHFDGSFELPRPEGTGVAVGFQNVGLIAVAAGPDVLVIDWLGLGDPIGSHVELTTDQNRVGHEKKLGLEWALARYADPERPGNQGGTAWSAARKAMSCGDVAQVLEAVTEPLTPARFLSNIVGAPHLTTLRIQGGAGDVLKTCQPEEE